MRLNGRYLTLKPVKNGLELYLTEEGKQWIAESDVGEFWEFRAFWELFEDFTENGWEMLAPEDFGALTSADIILSPDAVYDEDGNLVSVETVYWDERYQIENIVETLRDTGRAFLLKG